MDIRLVDYYESVGQDLSTHLNWLRSNGYESVLCWLPHDGEQHSRTESITYEGSIKKAGFKTRILKNQGAGAAMQRIEASRRMFPAMYFDAVKCDAGIEAIGWYHEKKDDARNIGLGPAHDWSSHGADAFGMISVCYEQIQREKLRNRDEIVVPRYKQYDNGIM